MPAAAPALHRPASFRIAKRLLARCSRANLLPPLELDLEALERKASEQTGLDDFGDGWFRGPLRVLLDALRDEARLNVVGRIVAHHHVAKLLRDRLRTEQWFADHPEIRERPLAPPVVVVGAMRSGTTRLHRLLAADDRFAHLRFFETFSPVPDPEALNGHDKRKRNAGLSLRLLHHANPTTAIVHPTGPTEPEEELGLFVSSAWGMKHETQWRVPSYAAWCEAEDATPAYRRMADLLRLVGWHRGEDPAKPWLLKTPQHMVDLPAMLRVFPDARIVFIHRDPAAVVGSSCSLVWNQMSLQSDHADPRWIGREWLRKTRLKVDRMAAASRAIPEGRAIHVGYDEMDRDWTAAMRRIYGFLGLDLAPALPAMQDYVARSEREKFRTHRYRLSDFGLSDTEVRDAFADYVRDFEVPAGNGEDALNGTRVAAAQGESAFLLSSARRSTS